MAKAWRNENARKINEERAAGIRQPRARQQMQQKVRIVGGASWLIQGLMLHAGYMQPTTNVPNVEVPPTEGMAKRVLRKLRNWWNK